MIKPLPGYVLVEPIKEESKSSGGIYMPEMTKDKPSKGKVIACGDVEKKEYTIECPVKVDQIVIYKKWTNQEVQSGGKTYLLVEFKDLLAIEEDEKN